MPRLPVLSARQMTKVLVAMGFALVRQRGSHLIFEHPDGRTTVVPKHAGEKIDRGLLAKIIKHDLAIERDEFLRHL